MGNQDAVDALFSRFDNEEENLVDFSDSSSETKVSENKEDTKIETKTDDSDKSVESKEEKLDDNTPFHKHPRWKQKLDENKSLKENNKSMQDKFDNMQKEIEALKSKPLTDEQLEKMSPKEIMEHTREQIEKESSQKTELQNKKDADADKYIDDSLQGLKDE